MVLTNIKNIQYSVEYFSLKNVSLHHGPIQTGMYEGGPKNNRTLNLAREVDVVVRCAARCCRSTQYSSTLLCGVNLG